MVVDNNQHLTLNIQHLTLNIQHSPKGLLLPSKTSPFALQNESFYQQKGALLQCKRTPFEIRLLSDAVSGCVDVVFIPQHSWSWATPD